MLAIRKVAHKSNSVNACTFVDCLDLMTVAFVCCIGYLNAALFVADPQHVACLTTILPITVFELHY